MSQERLITRTEKQIEFLSAIYKKSPDVIFDLGANVGLYSCLFAEKYSEAMIYAFEPVPSNFKTLEENIKLNNLSNVKTFNFGLAQEEHDANLYIPKVRESENTGLYSIKISESDGKDAEKGHFKNLGEWCKDNDVYPNLIKMDCEGCELEIILSSIDVIKKADVLFLEEKFGNSPKLRSILGEFFNISRTILELTCIKK